MMPITVRMEMAGTTILRIGRGREGGRNASDLAIKRLLVPLVFHPLLPVLPYPTPHQPSLPPSLPTYLAPMRGTLKEDSLRLQLHTVLIAQCSAGGLQALAFLLQEGVERREGGREGKSE